MLSHENFSSCIKYLFSSSAVMPATFTSSESWSHVSISSAPCSKASRQRLAWYTRRISAISKRRHVYIHSPKEQNATEIWKNPEGQRQAVYVANPEPTRNTQLSPAARLLVSFPCPGPAPIPRTVTCARAHVRVSISISLRSYW